MARYAVRILYGDEDWVRGCRVRRVYEGRHMVVRVNAESPDMALVGAIAQFVAKWSPLYDAADILGVEITGVSEKPPAASDTPRRPHARKATTAPKTSGAHARGGKGRSRA